MRNKIIEYLTKEGYAVSIAPYEVMAACKTWYANEPIEGFHERKTVQGRTYQLARTNMAKRCCADDADLLEVVEISAESMDVQGLLDGVLEDNNFQVKLREQLELTSAIGTTGSYLRIVGADEYDNGEIIGGRIAINYADGTNIIPLSVENGKVTECAFAGADTDRGKQTNTLVIFKRVTQNQYSAKTVMFDKHWKIINSQDITYPEGMVPFGILTVAGVNNIADMAGFGVPKIWNATSYLKGLDLAWTTFIRDLEKADKLILMNEQMLKFDDNGKPIPPSKSAQELFCFLGEKLPDEKSLIQEYNPTIRVDEITKAMELNLSMLSNMFGYGTRKYSFEQGQIRTATEYIGEKQDMMQELNKQRHNVEAYIKTLCEGIVYLYNSQYSGTLNPQEELTVDFDDSYINDRESMLEDMREDVVTLGLPKITERYLMEKYKLTDEEARAWLEDRPEEDDENKAVPAGLSTLNGAQTSSLINTIQQYQNKALTYNQAVSIISRSIGVSEEDAKNIIGDMNDAIR